MEMNLHLANADRDIDRRFLGLINSTPRLAAYFIMSIAIAVLFGWLLDVNMLKSLSPHWVSMKPSTAIGFILTAIALRQFQVFPRTKKGRLSWQIPAFLITLDGVATLGFHLAGFHNGVDRFLFSEAQGNHGSIPPEMVTPITGLNFFLLGLSFFSLKLETKRGHPYAHFLATFIGINVIFVLLNYVFRSDEVYGIASYTQMAFHTAILFGVATLGVFCINLNHGFLSILITRKPAGIVARTISIAGITMPVVLGFFRVVGERADLYPMEVGTALYGTLIVVTFLGAAWWTAIMVERVEEHRIKVAREQERLKAEAAIRDKFISMLAHDLRTPLNTAKVSAQLIERKAKDPEASRTYAKKISESIGRTDRMIQDLLDLKRISEGHPLQIHVEQLSLTEVCQQTVSDLALTHGERFLIQGSDVTGYWSRSSLSRLLENLLTNAVKYGSQDTPITVSIRRVEERVLLSVHNYGDPISSEDLERLFMPYERAVTAQLSGMSGWGIGLTIVQAMARAHGGSIIVESAPELGTTFTADLPIDARPFA